MPFEIYNRDGDVSKPDEDDVLCACCVNIRGKEPYIQIYLDSENGRKVVDRYDSYRQKLSLQYKIPESKSKKSKRAL